MYPVCSLSNVFTVCHLTVTVAVVDTDGLISLAGHHREHWQDQPAVYIGLRYPKDVRKRRHHRRHRLQQPSTDKDVQSVRPGNDSPQYCDNSNRSHLNR